MTEQRRRKRAGLEKLRDEQMERIGRLSKGTVETYLKRGKKLIANGRLMSPEQYAQLKADQGQPLSDKSVYGDRAAYRHMIIFALNHKLKDAARYETLGQTDEMKQALETAQIWAQRWDASQPDYARQNQEKGKLSEEQRIARGLTPQKNKKTTSKRRTLPKDSYWREKLVDEIRPMDARNAALIMSVTGCRPEELTRPIKLAVNGDRLYITLSGAKVSDVQPSGIRSRTIGIHPKTLHERELFEKVKAVYAPFVWKYEHTKYNLYKILTRAAKRCKIGDVSCYSFRHQFSSDLKALGAERVEIAQAMGQQTTKSQQFYGHWTQGGRSTGLETVEASQVVRDNADIGRLASRRADADLLGQAMRDDVDREDPGWW